MDWVGQAAGWLRDVLAQPWLDAWQPTIAATPDWALLAAGPATLLLTALLLRIIGPGPRAPAKDAQSQASQGQPTSAPRRVEPTPVAEPPPAPPAPKPVAMQSASAPASTPSPSADDDEDNRSVRVFVSSTFLDMQSERDELVTKAFPALRAKYRARGVEVFEVDPVPSTYRFFKTPLM